MICDLSCHTSPHGLVDNHNRPPFDEVTTLSHSLSPYIYVQTGFFDFVSSWDFYFTCLNMMHMVYVVVVFISWFGSDTHDDILHEFWICCSASDNLHHGASWWCKGEGASESLEMVAWLRGFSSELQGRKSPWVFLVSPRLSLHWQPEMLFRSVYYFSSLLNSNAYLFFWHILFLACSIWCLMLSQSLWYIQRWPRRISLLK